LIVLSLLAIVSATTNRALSEITGAVTTLTVTATYPDAGVAPTVTSLTYPTTYSSVNPTAFTIVGAGSFVGNNTIAYGTITFTNGGTSVTVQFGAGSPTGNNQVLGANGAVVFTVGGTYTPSLVQVTTAALRTYTVTVAGLVNVAVTAYVPPTLASLQFVQPQTGGCDATGCSTPVNGSAALTPARTQTFLSVFFRPTTASTGVKFALVSSVSGAGTADFNVQSSPLVAYVGGLVNGLFVPQSSTLASNTRIPAGNSMAVSAQSIEQNYASTYFSENSVGTNVQFTGGSTDVTAPTCSVVTVSPTTATTTTPDAPVTITVTVTCADEQGGSGLWTKGYVSQATINSGGSPVTLQAFSTLFTGATDTFDIPTPYISGSFSIIGVFAVDNAGNAVLYGSCADVADLSTVCGAGSSASTVAVSLFSMVILALFALFA
jgi:hypothetical protein